MRIMNGVMKTKLILLFTVPFLLAGCHDIDGSSSSVEESDTSSSSEEESSSEESSSQESTDIDLHVTDNMVGTWYMSSTTNGLFEINSIFKINANDTLEFGTRTLTLKGHYENYEETYEFVYGTIHFIASYDVDHKGIDWGYKNGDNADMGFALSEPVDDKTKYDYEGNEFPMDKTKEYLGTTLDIPTAESDSYRLQLYVSPLYDKPKVACLFVLNFTAKQTLAYLKTLQENGYTFYKDLPSKEVSNETFYTCYDAAKTYSIRIHHWAKDGDEPEQMTLHIYNYQEQINN